MFSRLIGLIFLLAAGYLLVVFAAPDIADQYGNKELNAKIRAIKEQSLSFGSGELSPSSLFDELTGKATEFASGTKQLIDESKQTVNQIQTTVTEKTEQVKQAADSVQKAIDAVNTAKDDVQKVTTFSGTTNTGTVK